MILWPENAGLPLLVLTLAAGGNGQPVGTSSATSAPGSSPQPAGVEAGV